MEISPRYSTNRLFVAGKIAIFLFSLILAFDRTLALSIILYADKSSELAISFSSLLEGVLSFIYIYAAEAIGGIGNFLIGFVNMITPLALDFKLVIPWREAFIFLALYHAPIFFDVFSKAKLPPYGLSSILLRLAGYILSVVFAAITIYLISGYSYDTTTTLLISFTVGLLVFRVFFAVQFSLDQLYDKGKSFRTSLFNKLIKQGIPLFITPIIILVMYICTPFFHSAIYNFILIMLSVFILGLIHIKSASIKNIEKQYLDENNKIKHPIKLWFKYTFLPRTAVSEDMFPGHFKNGMAIAITSLICTTITLVFQIL